MDKEQTIRPHIQRIRVQYNGGPGWSTKITDYETGKPLDSLTAFSWSVDLNNPDLRDGIATLIVFQPSIDIVVDAHVKNVCPCCAREVEEVSR
jgi:hypothetical protein